MTDTKSWLRRGLMGSTTMPMGTLPSRHVHTHSADGSCCGHDHGHHDHAHDDSHADHVHDENCKH